ncbi:MAG: HalOD1 output domain-containing protein [Haloferacaceae archaeon]
MTEQLAVSVECTSVREVSAHARDGSPVVTVVEVVADVAGVDPTALPPLQHRIDPDVINKFVASAASDTNGTANLCFTYAGWNVFVRADGTIVVGDPTEKSAPTPLF